MPEGERPLASATLLTGRLLGASPVLFGGLPATSGESSLELELSFEADLEECDDFAFNVADVLDDKSVPGTEAGSDTQDFEIAFPPALLRTLFPERCLCIGVRDKTC